MSKVNEMAMKELQRCLAGAYNAVGAEGFYGSVLSALPSFGTKFASINSAYGTNYSEEDVEEYGHEQFVRVELAYHDYMLGKCSNWV